MTTPENPAFRSPKGDHNRRLALGMDIEELAFEARVTPAALHEHETTAPDHDFNIFIADLIGAALERLEANPPSS